MNKEKTMKTKVFYFTGTGNSLHVAKQLVQNICDSELISVSKVIDTNIEFSCDKIIIVFPVYFWGLPNIITEFINKIKVPNTTSIYAIATNGGLAGDPHKYIKKILTKTNNILSAGFLVWMPENFILRYPPFPKWLEGFCLKIADKKIVKIIDNIKINKTGIYQKSRYLFNWFLSMQGEYLAKQIFINKNIKPKDYFWANEKCTQCGLCIKICPKNNISLNKGVLSWGENCELCVSCLHWCPQEAIQMKKVTIKRKRYHHPEITINELFMKKDI